MGQMFFPWHENKLVVRKTQTTTRHGFSVQTLINIKLKLNNQ